MINPETLRHFLRLQRIAVGSNREQENRAAGFHFRLYGGKLRCNTAQFTIGETDPAVIVDSGAVMELSVPAEQNLLFCRTVQKLFIEK